MPALEAIEKEIRSRYLRKIVQEMIKDIDAGMNLHETLERSNLYKGYVITLIRIGEETGTLAKNLKVIVERQAKERDFRSKIQSALLYPSIIMTMTIGLGIFITWFILPRLSTVFSGLDMDPPLITRILLSLGEFLDQYGNIVMPVLLGLIVSLVYVLFVNKKTKHIGQEILIRTPVVKKLLKEIEISRFSFVLGTLLEAGLSIEDALISLTEVRTFRRYTNLYKFIAENIPKGDSFSEAFSKYRKLDSVIPAPVQQMIISAEKSGDLSQVLLKVSYIYESKIETSAKNLSVVLEPIMLVIVWIGVLLIAIAVILPVYSLVGNLNSY